MIFPIYIVLSQIYIKKLIYVPNSVKNNRSVDFGRFCWRNEDLWLSLPVKKCLDMRILILNGPNLNLLGKREPGIYGSDCFEDYFRKLKDEYAGVELEYFQSNHEGALIDKLHEVGFAFDGVVFNAGAYTHTSVALLDAIKAIKTPVVEVHISNVHQREDFRHKSMISSACKGVICGFGLNSYRLALEALLMEK